MNQDPFKEYIKASEPGRRDKGYAWHTAIGLQAVDGLQTSEYLVQTAVRNIEGEISFAEADALLQSYYEQNRTSSDDRTEEADKVSARIAALLSEQAFSLTLCGRSSDEGMLKIQAPSMIIMAEPWVKHSK